VSWTKGTGDTGTLRGDLRASLLLAFDLPKARHIDQVIDVVLARAIATCTKRPNRSR